MTRTIAVVPCSATKVGHRAAAQDLYSSTYFQGALRAALDTTDEVYVLSALHGLVALDTLLDPYDVRMGDAGSVTDDTLAMQAVRLGFDEADVYGFLPNTYFETLDRALRPAGVYVTPVYEGTSGIGDQKRVARIVAQQEDRP